MIHIVIPMAGAGSRFQVAGYDLPKPFIDVNGRMMIEHVLDGIRRPGVTYTLIIQEQFRRDHAERLDMLAQKYGVNFIAVQKLTQGAACTALAAHEIINNDDMVIFVDSDNFFDNDAFNRFIDDAIARQLDGSLLTFNTDRDCFSFVELDTDGYAVRTREKDPISNHAITGVYLFRRGRDFVRFAIDMMIYGDRSKNEFYMSNVYNWAISAGLKIGCMDIQANEWVCVGTPEQLERFLNV